MKVFYNILRLLLISLLIFYPIYVIVLLKEEKAVSENSISGINTSRHPKSHSMLHHCINQDFEPTSDYSIWTLLNDNMDYTKGAVKIGKGVKRYTKTNVDLVVMELKTKPLGEKHWEILSEVGYKRCTVESIPLPPRVKTRPSLKEKFAVLHLWTMEVYDTILFLDADTLVQNSLDNLLHMDLKGKALGVTKALKAFQMKKWADAFNSGVMLLHPRSKEYERLITLLNNRNFKFEYYMSDQGFLNEVYKKDWYDIGFVNNANIAFYASTSPRRFWDEHKLEDINIIHYTMEKPWNCDPKGPYQPLCDLWRNVY
jgi:alpha-N-acetylglucosamine transferase